MTVHSFHIAMACFAGVVVAAFVDAEARLDQEEECDIRSSLHLLQVSAAVLKQQSLASSNQSSRQSAQGLVNATIVYTIHDLAQKIKEARLQQPMNPFVYTPMRSIATLAVSDPVLTTSMSWYNYVVCGLVVFSLLSLIMMTVGACTKAEHEDETQDEGSGEEFQTAKFLGGFLSVIDFNEWMQYGFFPTWCLERGLSIQDALLAMAMSGVGALIATPCLQYLIPHLGAPANSVWYGARLYALTRLLFIALMFVPTSMLFYAACIVTFLTGVFWSMNEVSAMAWCALSVTRDKRVAAFSLMSGGRMLGSVFGPGIGGILYSVVGLWLPFAVGFAILVLVQESGRSYFRLPCDGLPDASSKTGSILFEFPIFISLVVSTGVWTCLLSIIEWQQLWMLAQYALQTWEYGLYITVLMVALVLFTLVVVMQVSKLMTPVSATVLGCLIMASAYVIIDSPLLPFLPHTSVWISMVGTLIFMFGCIVVVIVLSAFIPNYAIGCGWSEVDAAVQGAVANIFTAGLAMMIGPAVAGYLIERIGVPQLCTVFAALCVCLAFLMSLLYPVQGTAVGMKVEEKEEAGDRSWFKNKRESSWRGPGSCFCFAFPMSAPEWLRKQEGESVGSGRGGG